MKPDAECHCQQPQEPIVATKTNTAWGRCVHGNIMELVYPGIWTVITDPSHAYAVAHILTQEPRRLAVLKKVVERVLEWKDLPGNIDDYETTQEDRDALWDIVAACDAALVELDALNGD